MYIYLCALVIFKSQIFLQCFLLNYIIFSFYTVCTCIFSSIKTVTDINILYETETEGIDNFGFKWVLLIPTSKYDLTLYIK